jgi:parallel beta-helix repeat protein
MFKTLVLMLFTSTLVRRCVAFDIVVGQEDCIGSCINYNKANADAFPAIQDAFNRVRAAGGGRVIIKQGIYTVSSNLNMFSNTYLVGEGMDNTIIKLQDFASPWKFNTTTRAGLLRSVFRNEQKCENLYVGHLTLNGNKENQNTDINSQYGRYGYFTEGCTNVYLESVRIERFQGYGFDPHGWKKAPGGALYGKNLTLMNCVANDNDWDGFTLDQTNGMFLKNNTAYNNGRHGFNVVTGSYNVYITDAYTMFNGFYYYKGTSGCGIKLQNNLQLGTNDIVIVNSTLAYDNKGGICTNDVFDVRINNVAVIARRECYNFINSRSFIVTNNVCNHTKIFRELNNVDILKSNNTVGMPSLMPTINFNVTFGNITDANDANDANDATGNDDIEGDETRALCPSGVFNKMVCCLAMCGSCGGNQCGSRPGGATNCCQTQILSSNRSCDEFEPPCVF